jgi:ribosomal protein S18 acetylase RimI-like enzyme
VTAQPFLKEHLPAAAALLARQAAALRQELPLLPARTEQVQAAASLLAALLEKPESSGTVLVEQGELAGCLLGSYGENDFFGRHVWVPYGGLALRDAGDADALGELYAAAGDGWMQDGVLNHYLVCPLVPHWLEVFFALSFGQEQAYALASLAEERAQPAPSPGIHLRQVQPGDAAQLAENAHWIAAFLNTAPVWEPVPPAHLERIRPAYAGLAQDPTSTTWIALDGEQLVGYAVFYATEQGAEHYLGDPGAGHFAAAAVHPAYRRRGLGRALFTRLLNAARQAGFRVLYSDWRTTNLSAAQVWPRFGFQPYAVRLLRRVNPRYARWG